MAYYFSGVSDAYTFDILREAGVRHVLVDPWDLQHVPDDWDGDLALDSGAYKEFKEGNKSLSLSEYTEIARSRKFSLVVSKDVIGDFETSHANWLALKELELDAPLVPVWGYGDGGDEGNSRMEQYLDNAAVVGIGGVAKLMRDKDLKMLRELSAMCGAFPNRFHIFGDNWVQAINKLNPDIFSADSSKWLDGGRYGSVAFVDTRNGKLSMAPARVLPGLEHLVNQEGDDAAERKRKRRARLVHNARVMNDFLNPVNPAAQEVVQEIQEIQERPACQV